MAAPSTFPQLLAVVVRDRPGHPALIVADESLSYAELDRRSARMARALVATGVGKGTRLGLLAPDGVLWLTTVATRARAMRAERCSSSAYVSDSSATMRAA